jgi:CRP-like cAMP-binding protein
MSLLLTSIHTKSVQAVEDSELLVLDKDSFRRLLDRYPEVAERVHERLEEREEQTAFETETATS